MDIGQTVYSYNALISSAISMIESLCVLCNKKDNNYGEEMNIIIHNVRLCNEKCAFRLLIFPNQILNSIVELIRQMSRILQRLQFFLIFHSFLSINIK